MVGSAISVDDDSAGRGTCDPPFAGQPGGRNMNETGSTVRRRLTSAARASLAALLTATAVAVATPASAQLPDQPDGAVAGIPMNFTEANVGQYTVPDPLVLANGDKVTDARTWYEQRRPEVLALVEENVYGRAPAPRPDLAVDVFDAGTLAFDGKARRKQLTIYFSAARDTQYVDVVVYTPAAAEGRVPLLVQIGWSPNNLAVQDSGLKVGRAWSAETKMRTPATEGRPFGGVVDVPGIVARGYGVATFNYNDVDPDSRDSVAYGVRGLYLQDGAQEPAADEWGTVAAWAWAVQRVVDYLVTDSDVDAERIAVLGVSRLGKTALWAAALDQRIALVIASSTSDGGAALMRRNYGEGIAHLVEPSRFPFHYSRSFASWADRIDDMPFDGHFLLALIAPRPLLLQTGNTDHRTDPYGEFLAAKAATPVYELLGAEGIAQYSMPGAGKPLMTTLGYLVHEGGHGAQPADWPVFLDFMDKHLKP